MIYLLMWSDETEKLKMIKFSKKKLACVLCGIFITICLLGWEVYLYHEVNAYRSERISAQAGNNPFQSKKIAFLGDSITYGYDPNNKGKQMKNPWVKQVGEKLHVRECKNYGVNSASVMNIKGTKMAAIDDYQKMDEDIDILGVMIGINDAYRQYPLGQFSDRTPDTFYGALHLMWQRILKRYPPETGKKVFFIMYPQYDVLPFWPEYKKALYEVAEYYSVPICELSKEMGMSPYADDQYQYWPEEAYKGQEGFHSAHPSQKGADLYADVIANYMWRQFGVE